MPITVLAVGKKHETWIQPGIERYEKRLHGAWNIAWVLLPHSALPSHQARISESKHILSHLKPQDYVILLDERGTILDSPALSRLITTQHLRAASVVFVIGGAYGVDEAVFKRANTLWSLSKLVFPHQLVRLLLTEQLYRAQEIALGHPYHHQ